MGSRGKPRPQTDFGAFRARKIASGGQCVTFLVILVDRFLIPADGWVGRSNPWNPTGLPAWYVMYQCCDGVIVLNVCYRLQRLLQNIMAETQNKTLIFVETKRKADELQRRMQRDGLVLGRQILLAVSATG